MEQGAGIKGQDSQNTTVQWSFGARVRGHCLNFFEYNHKQEILQSHRFMTPNPSSLFARTA